MELTRRELLKSLAGGVAALAVVAVPLPLEAEPCDCGPCSPCSPGEIEVTFEPIESPEWKLWYQLSGIRYITEDVLDDHGVLVDFKYMGAIEMWEKNWRCKWNCVPPPDYHPGRYPAPEGFEQVYGAYKMDQLENGDFFAKYTIRYEREMKTWAIPRYNPAE